MHVSSLQKVLFPLKSSIFTWYPINVNIKKVQLLLTRAGAGTGVEAMEGTNVGANGSFS